MPEEHDVLPQLLHQARLLHISVGIKAGDEGVHDAQLVQGLGMGLQRLVAARHCLGTLQPAQALSPLLMHRLMSVLLVWHNAQRTCLHFPAEEICIGLPSRTSSRDNCIHS